MNNLRVELEKIITSGQFTTKEAKQLLGYNWNSLTSDFGNGINAVSIGQIGLVPASAQSILFKAQPGSDILTLTLGGQNIPFIALATEPNYTLYCGDISAFAGQLLELAFTASPGSLGQTGWNLDSIEFSSQPIPEPSTYTLLIAGVGILFRYRQFAFQRPAVKPVENLRDSLHCEN